MLQNNIMKSLVTSDFQNDSASLWNSNKYSLIIWFFSLYCAIPAPRSPSNQQQQYTFKDLLNMELRWNSDVENVVTAHSFQVSVEVCCTAAVLKERLGNLKLPLPLLNQKKWRDWKFWFTTSQWCRNQGGGGAGGSVHPIPTLHRGGQIMPPITTVFYVLKFVYGGWENDFLLLKIIFWSPQNDLSDVIKTYIDIDNEKKFELWVT